MVADTQAPMRRLPVDWLPRAIVSGFIASVVMSITFFIAYGLARIVSTVELSPRRGAATFRDWMEALTNNQVLDLAATSLYTAGAVHLAVGVLWAVLYAYSFEPRLPGPGWLRGITFSLIPWVLSLAVFLPVVGGGFFGAAIGAGPIPALGNLILHLAYGATLGAIYGPLGDIPADQFPYAGATDDPRVVAHYEQGAAKGIVFGALIGALIGAVGAVSTQFQPNALVLGVPAFAFIPVTAVLGATFGGFLGSFAGLAPEQSR